MFTFAAIEMSYVTRFREPIKKTLKRHIFMDFPMSFAIISKINQLIKNFTNYVRLNFIDFIVYIYCQKTYMNQSRYRSPFHSDAISEATIIAVISVLKELHMHCLSDPRQSTGAFFAFLINYRKSRVLHYGEVPSELHVNVTVLDDRRRCAATSRPHRDEVRPLW